MLLVKPVWINKNQFTRLETGFKIEQEDNHLIVNSITSGEKILIPLVNVIYANIETEYFGKPVEVQIELTPIEELEEKRKPEKKSKKIK